MSKSRGPVAKLRHKLNAQNNRRAHGGYKPFSDNGEMGDKRDGGCRHIEPKKVVPSYDLNAKVVNRLPAGRASGLHRDIGKVGKGGRRADKACYGDFCRTAISGRGLVYDAVVYDEHAVWPLYRAE